MTTAETGLTLVQGRTYHLHYTYDAEHNVITVEMSTGGTVLKSFSFAGTASGHILTIPANGMVAEFGHYFGQEGPEVASPGWNYYDLRVEMVPY